MPDLLADVFDRRNHDVVGDRAQRQVVKLDIAADVGVDAGGQVIECLARQLFLATAHVEHDVGADRGKAYYRHHRRGDQEFYRKPPRPAHHISAPSKSHRSLPIAMDATGVVATGLSDDNDLLMS